MSERLFVVESRNTKRHPQAKWLPMNQAPFTRRADARTMRDRLNKAAQLAHAGDEYRTSLWTRSADVVRIKGVTHETKIA